jgi:hypothetical protein
VAQETVVKEQLSSWAILAGHGLTQQLLQTDFHLVCSFWLYTSEPSGWRLILASPRVETEGTLSSYERIRKILSPTSPEADWASYAITVFRPDVPLVRAIRSLGEFRIPDLPAGPTTYLPVPKRVNMANVDGIFIEDAYIYFSS